MAGRRVSAVQVTNHPPTAVKPRQDGKGTCARGGIDAHRNIMARAGDTALFVLGDLWPGGPGTRLGVDAGLLGGGVGGRAGGGGGGWGLRGVSAGRGCWPAAGRGAGAGRRAGGGAPGWLGGKLGAGTVSGSWRVWV